MKKTLIVLGILVALLGITACTRTERNVATGAAVGAGLGAGVGAIMSEKDK